MRQIDKKDASILYHLSLNARATLAKLSRSTKLSKEVLHYRINKLEQAGIIEGYYAIINPHAVGKMFCRVYLKARTMNAETQNAFIFFLKNHQKVLWFFELEGDLDYLFVVCCKNMTEFDVFYQDCTDKFGKYVSQKYFSWMKQVQYFKHKFLLSKEDTTSLAIGGVLQEAQLDLADKKILSSLSKSANGSFLELARTLRMPVKTVIHKIRRLEQEKIIVGYNTRINHQLLGFTQRKVMLNLNDPSRSSLNKLVSFLAAHPCTVFITFAIGQYDLEFEMMERTYEDFHCLMQSLKQAFPDVLKDYFTVVFYAELKTEQVLLA